MYGKAVFCPCARPVKVMDGFRVVGGSDSDGWVSARPVSSVYKKKCMRVSRRFISRILLVRLCSESHANRLKTDVMVGRPHNKLIGIARPRKAEKVTDKHRLILLSETPTITQYAQEKCKTFGQRSHTTASVLIVPVCE